MELEAAVLLFLLVLLAMAIYLPYRALRALWRWLSGAERREREEQRREEQERHQREEEYERLMAAARRAMDDAKEQFRSAINDRKFPPVHTLAILNYCDDEVPATEKDLLEQMLWGHCTAWEMDYAKAVRLIEQFQRDEQESRHRGRADDDPNRPVTESEAFTLLGVAQGCSQEELSNAYRSTVAQWHPDKLDTMAPELREFATQKTARINEAYRVLRSTAVG